MYFSHMVYLNKYFGMILTELPSRRGSVTSSCLLKFKFKFHLDEKISFGSV